MPLVKMFTGLANYTCPKCGSPVQISTYHSADHKRGDYWHRCRNLACDYCKWEIGGRVDWSENQENGPHGGFGVGRLVGD
jgi:hypothetical protein